MKISKLAVCLMLIVIISFYDCKKDNNNGSSSSNTWSWLGITYTANTVYTNGCPYFCALNANDSSSNPNSYSGLYLDFPNGFPDTAGTYTYTVISNNYTRINGQPPRWVIVSCDNQITSGGQSNYQYSSTGGSGNQTVTVTLSANNKISASASNLTLQNTLNAGDSASNCSFNIAQK